MSEKFENISQKLIKFYNKLEFVGHEYCVLVL